MYIIIKFASTTANTFDRKVVKIKVKNLSLSSKKVLGCGRPSTFFMIVEGYIFNATKPRPRQAVKK